MGNCCTGMPGGKAAIVGRDDSNPPNEAISAFLNSRGFHNLFHQIELSLSASQLGDRDILSKSDPMAIVYIKGKDGSLKELGRTEVVLNSINPKWIRKYNIRYHFETIQSLVFQIYDIDTNFHNVEPKVLRLEEQQFLGEATCTLAEIVTKPNRALTLNLKRRGDDFASGQPHKLGKLTVYAEQIINSKIVNELVFRCSDLGAKDVFSKSDPFLIISKIVKYGTKVPVAKTEVLKNDHNPMWKPVSVEVEQVGSKDSPLSIECYDYNGNGKHVFLGEVQKSLVELEKLHSTGIGANLFVPGARSPQNKVLKSQLYVDNFSEKTQYTFLDYLNSGFELNFMVAIDFTASNGNPRLPDSLHYIDPTGRPNSYQRAIMQVGDVLQYYDSDKRFPAWGFGARPFDSSVSHCFNLNGSSTNCEVEGIHGIMTAYSSAVQNVSFAGPTLFGDVITTAADIASLAVANNPQKYCVLLIITDGEITDLHETKDALVKASDLPLSILIVGVGGADFEEMEHLDADKGDRLETAAGRVASRDIVQFVPMRDVQNDEISVAESLLEELPSQFLAYMRVRNIYPTIT